MKILITGGCGYVGSVLIPILLQQGHKVISIDTKWFGDFLPKNKNLLNLKLDLKDIEKINLKGVEAIIHLASISNDPMAELDKNLSWEISALSTYKLLEHAKKFNVKRFIYASSGSVYGIKKEKEVTEDLDLKPISLYNKVKMCTERIILSYKKYMEIFIIRPATVCGYSPRMRLDLTVNILTFSALSKKNITVFGGKQIRPNIHISDLCNLYVFFLKINKKFEGIYNAGFENKKIIDIAHDVSRVTKAKISVKKNLVDLRSYRLSSQKLLNIGFKPKKKIFDAILEMKELYMEKKLKNNPRFKSISWLKKII